MGSQANLLPMRTASSTCRLAPVPSVLVDLLVIVEYCLCCISAARSNSQLGFLSTSYVKQRPAAVETLVWQ